MRGYVFDFEGKKFFTFGGAKSHDCKDGVLCAEDYDSVRDMIADYKRRSILGESLRIDKLSWWEEELPTREEMERGIKNLEKVDFKVDYVITHCLPQNVAHFAEYKEPDCLKTYFLDLIKEYNLQFDAWYCGHYHCDRTFADMFNENFMGKYVIKYNDIERII